MIALAVWGWDTDTIGAMTGALVGARIGPRLAMDLPAEQLEEGPKFIEYIRDLASRLAQLD